MKFTLETTGYFYSAEKAEKLKKLGFTFRDSHYGQFAKCLESVDIEIDTLDDLVAFAREWGDVIINEGKIEIYDDYRE